MKTMHLTNSWHERSGGIAAFYRALVKEANQKGQFIRLVVPGSEDRVEEVGAFARIYHVQAPGSRLSPGYRTIYPRQFLFPGSKLQRILIAERPDLVEISDKYTLNYLGAVLRMRLLPAVSFRPLVVGVIHERIYDNFVAYLGKIPFSRQFCCSYMKWIYFPFFDHHIANSEYTAEELRKAAEGQLVSRGIWIRPMGVDLNCLSPRRRSAEARKRLVQSSGGSDASVLLLYAGRLAPEKNLRLLFDTFAELCRKGTRDYRLLIAGEGIERAKWEGMCGRELPGRAVFLGHIKDRETLADLYANSDVFVHPNPREPFGIAPLEAMASGLALVAPNAGGISSYANDNNAWTAEAEVGVFLKAIEEATAKDESYHQRIRRALETAQAYGWGSVASSFLDLYLELHNHSLQRGVAKVEVAGAAFYSIPDQSSRLSPMHLASQLAEKSFRLAWRLAGASEQQPPAIVSEPDRIPTAAETR